MKRIFVLLSALIITGFLITSHLGSARAEQGCADGFYPGGTQPGGQICVPIPGQRGDLGGNAAPAEWWEDRWGAIATALSGTTGIAGNASSKKEAQTAALKMCQQKGGTDCKVNITYRNSCGALAWGGGVMTTARADTLEIASRMALEGCSKDSPECRIFFSDCSFAERVR